MIEGVVNAAHEAVVNLALHGSTGQTRDIEAVIDTGISGGAPTLLRAGFVAVGMRRRRGAGPCSAQRRAAGRP